MRFAFAVLLLFSCATFAATNKKKFNELSTALRQHIQRGGATPWQAPLSP